MFGSCIISILYTGCAKIKKKLFRCQNCHSNVQIGYYADVHACHGFLFVCLQRLSGMLVFINWIHGAQEVAELSNFAHFRIDRLVDSLVQFLFSALPLQVLYLKENYVLLQLLN